MRVDLDSQIAIYGYFVYEAIIPTRHRPYIVYQTGQTGTSNVGTDSLELSVAFGMCFEEWEPQIHRLIIQFIRTTAGCNLI